MLYIDWIIELEGLPASMDAVLRRVGDAAVSLEGLCGRYQVSCTITDDLGIAAINREQRGIDRPTDVLSFPSVRYPAGATAGRHPNRLRREYDPQTRSIVLGDVVISLPAARRQATELGHSLTRELGFLFAHSLLHLMGYDHEETSQRTQMRRMEERIMEKTGLHRTLSDADFALLEAAQKAMHNAYAPYSRYRVGACIRTRDGKLYSGCNVENASFGLSLCAERNAMTTAVTQSDTGIEAVAIAARGAMPYPCGACRQFLREFAEPGTIRVIVANEEQIDITTLESLLPNSFGPQSLPEVNS